jgi:Translation initiation factor IF-2, N-terminal region
MRINELAKELEVKAKAILDALHEIGVTEKKAHSSSISDEEAEKVRQHFLKSHQATMKAEIKPKIDFSRVHRPGDILKLLQELDARPARPPRLRSEPEQPQVLQHLREKPIIGRIAAAIPRLESVSRTSQTHAAPAEPPGLVKRQIGHGPVYTTKVATGHANLEAAPFAKPEQKSPNQDAIEQAEEALRALRAQDKSR